MCKLKVARFLFICKICGKILCVCEIENHLKTLKCINKTTTLAKKKITKEIYSIYNYVQKQKGKGQQEHAPSEPCWLDLCYGFFKNTSQSKANFPMESWAWSLNLPFLSPSFLSRWTPKHFTCGLNVELSNHEGVLLVQTPVRFGSPEQHTFVGLLCLGFWAPIQS